MNHTFLLITVFFTLLTVSEKMNHHDIIVKQYVYFFKEIAVEKW